MQNVWSNPIFGLGNRDWVRPDRMASSTIDNFWLVVAIKFGTPALMFVTGAITAALLAKRGQWYGEARIADTNFVWTIAVVAALFVGYSAHFWSNAYSFFAFLIGAGSWKTTKFKEEEKTATKPNYSRFKSTK